MIFFVLFVLLRLLIFFFLDYFDFENNRIKNINYTTNCNNNNNNYNNKNRQQSQERGYPEMVTLVTISEVPVGYTTPTFPSLYWPVDDSMYEISYLYYSNDIWRFTVFWTLIIFVGFYGAAGISAALMRRKLLSGVLLVGFYVLIGGAQAFISGTVVAVVSAAIYRAGLFKMSTWVPMCAACFQLLFNLVTSYSTVSILM